MSSPSLYELVARNPHLRAALEQMLKARRGAETLKQDVWSVAVEVSSLLSAHCTVTELRLLVAAGYAEHREEVTRPKDRERSFRPETRLTFRSRSCFVLTEAGAAAVAGLEDESDLGEPKANAKAGRRVPRWSATARELRVDGRGLKRFRRPAPNLELVLAAFEEEGWPRHLDDPLPPAPGTNPQDRLHDAVRGLNGCQQPHLILFESDGRGKGIRWSWADRRPADAADLPRISPG